MTCLYDGTAGGVPAPAQRTMLMSTIEARLEYLVKTPTHFCFNLEAAQCPAQRVISERLTVSPDAALRHFSEPRTGNRFVRVDAPPGPLLLHYKADVEVYPRAIGEQLAEVPLGQLPDDVFPYLLPTRYCEADLLAPAAQQLFGNEAPGIDRVRTIVQWIRNSITYRSGSTTTLTTARDVFLQRAGVCRDFAHLGITMCRALNIPARIVVGYVWFDDPPQDFHAVFEAWLGGEWVLFDPTGMAPVDRLVRIGTGADAKDVAFSTFFGAVEMTRKEVSVLEHEPRTRPVDGEAALQLATVAAA